jgi:glycosyltransferase involved in cell wall biosynthesis
MKLLIHSYGYPSAESPYLHTFVEDEAKLLHAAPEIQLSVLVTNPLKSPSILQQKTFKQLGFPVREAGYLSIPRRKLSFITAAAIQRAIRPYLDKEQPDIVHSHFLYPAGLAAPLVQKMGIPYVITIHGDDFYSSISVPSLYARVKAALGIANKIICVGPDLKNDVITEFPEVTGKTEVVMHSVDFDYFNREADAVERPSELSSASDSSRINVLCVARIHRKKGLHLLIDAIAGSELLKQKCNFHIVGPLSDPAYRQELAGQINRYGLDNIHIHGPQEKSGLRKWYVHSDMYVQPSLDEPFGITILEALACGLPAVVTRSGGPQQMVNSENGVVCDISAQDIRTGLTKVATELETFSSAAVRKSVMTRFSADAKQQKLIKIYQEISQKTPVRP